MFSSKTLTKDQIQGYVDSYNDGKANLSTIATELGCSVPTAGRLLKLNGAKMRAKGRPKGSKTVNRKQLRPTVATVTPASPGVEQAQTVLPENSGEIAEQSENFIAFQQKILNYQHTA